MSKNNSSPAFKFVDVQHCQEDKNHIKCSPVSVIITLLSNSLIVEFYWNRKTMLLKFNNQLVWNAFVLALFLLFIFDSYILTIRFCFTSFVKSSSAVCTVNASQSFKLFSPLPPPHLINTWYYSALFSGCHFFCALCLVFCCHKCQTHFHSDSRFERTSLIYDYF